MHRWMGKVFFFPPFELKNKKQMLKRKDQTSWCFLLPFFHILFPVGKKKSLVTDTLLQCCTLTQSHHLQNPGDL